MAELTAEYLLLAYDLLAIYAALRKPKNAGKAFADMLESFLPQPRAHALLRVNDRCVCAYNRHGGPLTGHAQFRCIMDCGFACNLNLSTGQIFLTRLHAQQTQHCAPHACDLSLVDEFITQRRNWLITFRERLSGPLPPVDIDSEDEEEVGDGELDESGAEGQAAGEDVVEVQEQVEVAEMVVGGQDLEEDSFSEEEEQEAMGGAEEVGDEEEEVLEVEEMEEGVGGGEDLEAGGVDLEVSGEDLEQGGLDRSTGEEDGGASLDTSEESVDSEEASQHLDESQQDANNNDASLLASPPHVDQPAPPSSSESSPSSAASSAESSPVSDASHVATPVGAAFALPPPGSYDATPVLFSSGGSAESGASETATATSDSGAASSGGRRSVSPIPMASLSRAESTQSQLLSRENSELKVDGDEELEERENIVIMDPNERKAALSARFTPVLDSLHEEMEGLLQKDTENQTALQEAERQHNVTKQTLAAVQTTLKTTSDELATTKQSLTTSQNGETELRGLLEQKGDECEQLKRDKTTVETQLGDERREGETKGRTIERLDRELKAAEKKVVARDNTIVELERKNETQAIEYEEQEQRYEVLFGNFKEAKLYYQKLEKLIRIANMNPVKTNIVIPSNALDRLEDPLSPPAKQTGGAASRQTSNVDANASGGD